MISYLPELYPDELIYSWFCRYYIHTGCVTNVMAFQEILCHRSNTPSIEFLGHLKPSTEQLLHKLFDMNDLIINHTMFPQYARFIPLYQKKKALYHISSDFRDVHHLFAIPPRTQEDSNLKYCPICAEEDRNTYGEAYWHREHQIRNMSICSKHKCLLVRSNVPAKNTQAFTLHPAELCVELQKPKYTNNTSQMDFCEYMAGVFKTPINFERDVPTNAILYDKLRKTKYLIETNKARYTRHFIIELQNYYQNIYPNDIISAVQIQRALSGDTLSFSVICQIAFFLNISIDELTNSLLTNKQIEWEEAQKEYYKKIKEPIDMIAYDNKTAPEFKQYAHDIYTGAASDMGRPGRISKKEIYIRWGLSAAKLKKLPKCNAIMQKYDETFEENCARRIIWAYNNFISEKDKPCKWYILEKTSGVKIKNARKAIPYLSKYADKTIVNAIIKIMP